MDISLLARSFFHTLFIFLGFLILALAINAFPIVGLIAIGVAFFVVVWAMNLMLLETLRAEESEAERHE